MDIQYTQPKRLLTPTGGFLSGYSHSLNPYVGCSFGCSYCYVRKSPVGLFRKQEWGTWVDVKQGAAERLKKEIMLAKRKGAVTIFMSSSTDPYQPLEAGEQITRSLLEAMVQEPPDFLFVQTRSPLVTRDIDLFHELINRLRISVTVETDLEDVRRRFTPSAPPVAARLKALRELTQAGLPTQAAIAPLLPSSQEFAYKLAAVTNRVCVDDFFMGDGSQGRRTKAMRIEQRYEADESAVWYNPNAYLALEEHLKLAFRPEQIKISEQGFLPY